MMNYADVQYLNNANDILQYGEPRKERTGTGATSLFSPNKMRFDLREGFPLLTTKKLPFRIIAHELLWFLKGDTNIKYLLDNKVKIWNADAYRWWNHQEDTQMGMEYMSEEEFIEFATKYGYDLGPIYGKQWRGWETDILKFASYEEGAGLKPVELDQIKELIKALKENPTSRRHIVSAWNAGQLNKMALPPCHIIFQCYITNDGGVILQMYQRSADWFLGVPFNIASYALLTHMIAQVAGLYAREFIWVGGDAHIYDDHVDQMHEQINREPRKLPTLWLNPDITDIDDFTIEDIRIDGYDPHPPLKGKVSAG